MVSNLQIICRELRRVLYLLILETLCLFVFDSFIFSQSVLLLWVAYRCPNFRRSGSHDTPPTTPHGRFENAFPVWRENFPRSFKFDVEVDPPVSYFWREFRLLLTNFFVAGIEKQSGKGIRKNLQANSK